MPARMSICSPGSRLAARSTTRPHTLAPGLGAAAPADRGAQVVADHQRGTVEVKCGPQFRTAGFDDALADLLKRMDEAERLRQLYVAATRAREHLILSVFRGETGATHATQIVAGLAGAAAGLAAELALPIPAVDRAAAAEPAGLAELPAIPIQP